MDSNPIPIFLKLALPLTLPHSHRVTVTFAANSCNRLCYRTRAAVVSSSCRGLLSPYLVFNTEEFLLAHMMLMLCCCQENNWEPLAFLSPLKPTVTALLSLSRLYGSSLGQFHSSLATGREFIQKFLIQQETIGLE